MLVAMKPNAPNSLNQFDRDTVNRPLMRTRLGARTGAKRRAHHLHDPEYQPSIHREAGSRTP